MATSSASLVVSLFVEGRLSSFAKVLPTRTLVSHNVRTPPPPPPLSLERKTKRRFAIGLHTPNANHDTHRARGWGSRNDMKNRQRRASSDAAYTTNQRQLSKRRHRSALARLLPKLPNPTDLRRAALTRWRIQARLVTSGGSARRHYDTLRCKENKPKARAPDEHARDRGRGASYVAEIYKSFQFKVDVGCVAEKPRETRVSPAADFLYFILL
jgi:hypothetical protein